MARESSERPFFQPNRNRIHRNLIDEEPKFRVHRLRITWIVGHLSAGTHLVALEQASGVRASQLVRYLKFATPPEAARARLLVAGTS